MYPWNRTDVPDKQQPQPMPGKDGSLSGPIGPAEKLLRGCGPLTEPPLPMGYDVVTPR